ncbi:hypothetical protein VFPPC_16562 [Pochonia chlamydosporia 170]|uniref:Uncharacterized protein n=1 Tax=Pochonia chlamydosporia 170 TaxID=1380566 RepID=A0A179F9N9_METCM|nr:hypothetical protein VFPPC_16562 [Pochonia chlamydosporia 170]OAQ61809.1 hypothetical protein VFPPC_16562 [Pochonia chlamydosporia 170]
MLWVRMILLRVGRVFQISITAALAARIRHLEIERQVQSLSSPSTYHCFTKSICLGWTWYSFSGLGILKRKLHCDRLTLRR